MSTKKENWEMKYKLSLAIPHYNEEDNVKTTIPHIFNAFSKEGIPIEIIAVNNGSKDGTLKRLIQLKKDYKDLKIISLKENRGFGGGIIAGLENCSSDIIGFTCADEQIKPKSVLRVYKFFKKYDLDIAKANRVKRHDGLSRVVYSRLFNLILKVMFNLKIRDINGYPVIFRKSLFKKMGLRKKNWMINTEILIKSKRLNVKFGETDAIFHKREKGKTSVKIQTLFDFLFQIIMFRLECLFSKKNM